ncbi:MAG: chromosomal replication initiator protein DnaA, partial [Pseudomonadota bacterium]
MVRKAEEPLWAEASRILKADLGDAAWRRWIDPMDCVSIGADEARFASPSGFTADWVARHYETEILSALREAGAACDRLIVAARGNAPATCAASYAPPRRAASAANATVGEAFVDVGSAPLDRRYTFEQFVVGRPNELAHAAARRVAEDDQVVYNPVFLHGGVGLGKTHLMHAISWRIAERAPARKVLYLSAEQFMYRFIQAIRRQSTHDFKEHFRSVDVLMIDDVQFLAGKETTQEEFFHTFNALIDSGKQIVISGDRAPGEMDELQERIKSRLQWGLVVDIHPTDYELRLGILQTKAEAALAADPAVKLEPKVLEFLAHRISSNVRVLEGAL